MISNDPAFLVSLNSDLFALRYLDQGPFINIGYSDAYSNIFWPGSLLVCIHELPLFFLPLILFLPLMSIIWGKNFIILISFS